MLIPSAHVKCLYVFLAVLLTRNMMVIVVRLWCALSDVSHLMLDGSVCTGLNLALPSLD